MAVYMSGGKIVGSAGTALFTKFYSTNFPLTENPLSEGGIWIDGGISSPRTNPQSVAGHAYGTMSSFDGTNFPDSIAVLAASYHPNQSVQGTIFNSGAIAGLEVELVLRGDITATNNTGYEVDLVLSNTSLGLVRWNGAPNDFTILQSGITTNVSLANGSVWFAKIVGTLITVTCNGSAVTTYDTSADSLILQGGRPGLGFWNQTGSSANSPNFGWSNWQASEI